MDNHKYFSRCKELTCEEDLLSLNQAALFSGNKRHHKPLSLPLLFTKGMPVALHDFSESDLDLFLPYLIGCGAKMEGVHVWSIPSWWDRSFKYSATYIDVPVTTNRLQVLRSLVLRCYTHHSSHHLIEMSTWLAHIPRSCLKFIQTGDNEVTILSRNDNSLIYTISVDNLIYDLSSNISVFNSPGLNNFAIKSVTPVSPSKLCTIDLSDDTDTEENNNSVNPLPDSRNPLGEIIIAIDSDSNDSDPIKLPCENHEVIELSDTSSESDLSNHGQDQAELLTDSEPEFEEYVPNSRFCKADLVPVKDFMSYLNLSRLDDDEFPLKTSSQSNCRSQRINKHYINNLPLHRLVERVPKVSLSSPSHALLLVESYEKFCNSTKFTSVQMKRSAPLSRKLKSLCDKYKIKQCSVVLRPLPLSLIEKHLGTESSSKQNPTKVKKVD